MPSALQRSIRPFVVALCVVVATPGLAQSRPLTESRAVRLPPGDGIRLDGRMVEPVWAIAPATNSFTQLDPEEAKEASERTEVRVLFDDNALYVGVRLYDRGRVTGRLGRRDMDLGDSDWFGVMIDSYHDHRTAFGFDVNPAGVRRDEIKVINQDDNSWDPVWDVATSVDSLGWTAEYRIPYSQLRFSSEREQTWGIQFERVIGRRNEYAVSSFTPKADVGGVPRYGHLMGLRDLQPGRRLELLPYTVQRASYVDPGPNPFKKDPSFATSAGLDVVYRVSPNVTLNAALNPDFGQVEVDPAVVNLGVYETFFQEKRPLFVEGGEIFRFGADGTSGGQLFYSRRIGRAPSLAAPEAASDQPDATTILGAGKVSGKIGSWSLGILDAVTAEERARYRTPAGATARFVVEPLTNAFVGRARREARGGQTFVGVALTSVNRNLPSDAIAAALHSAAYAGGVDLRHEFANRTWVVSGDAEFSRVQGSTAAIVATQQRSNHYFQRPDAAHLAVDSLATSLGGYSLNVQLGKQQGLHWRGSVGMAMTSPGYEVNDLGFSYRTDRRDFDGTLSFVENRPGTVWRRWGVDLNHRIERNFRWQPILQISAISFGGATNGYWNIHAGVNRFYEAYDDRLTRGGPMALRPAWWQGFGFVGTDGRKPVTAQWIAQGERHDFGEWTYSLSPSLGLKTSTRWNLSVGPTFTKAYVPAQFVTSVLDTAYRATFGRRYLFSPLHRAELGVETRFNMSFTPRLSLESYVQPLISAADFGAATQFVRPKAFAFVAYGGDVPNLDFNLRSLRGNAVLRWEWRAGSTLYVAWQQSRSDFAPTGDFSFGRDRRALFQARPDNILLVKVNYWLNP